MCREVADSISGKRLYRIPFGTLIPFGTPIPHPTALMKITTTCGDAAVTRLN